MKKFSRFQELENKVTQLEDRTHAQITSLGERITKIEALLENICIDEARHEVDILAEKARNARANYQMMALKM